MNHDPRAGSTATDGDTLYREYVDWNGRSQRVWLRRLNVDQLYALRAAMPADALNEFRVRDELRRREVA